MERILALDIGDKTIGVAISDPLGITAQGLGTILRHGNNKEDVDRLRLIKEKYDVKKIVVGLPINMNNTIGPQAEKTIHFAKLIEKFLGVEIIYQDERLSSISAEKVLIEGNVRREHRKEYIDKIAASVILQTYLDRLKV